jgi:hypothetical protein
MPGTNLVAVKHVLHAAQAVRRPRTGAYVLMGLAVSGWMGFLVLAGVLLATRSAIAPESALRHEAPKAEPAPRPRLQVEPKLAVRLQVEPARTSPPPSAPIAYGLTVYEERRRVQEQVRQADTTDHDEGNVSAARNFYDYAAGKGWAPAALALAFTYDPHEMQRRGVTVAADTAKARACYLKARDLMDAAVAFYLSRLPPGRAEDTC